MATKKQGFKKVKFLQAIELAGVGYSPVGGPKQDGIYTAVPVEATEGWYFEALVKDGSVEDMGDGEEGGNDAIPDEQKDAFEASGMSDADWLNLPGVERDARTQVHAQKAAAKQALEAQDLMASAGETNGENAARRTAAAKTTNAAKK